MVVASVQHLVCLSEWDSKWKREKSKYNISFVPEVFYFNSEKQCADCCYSSLAFLEAKDVLPEMIDLQLSMQYFKIAEWT